jgi:hypothetical protein
MGQYVKTAVGNVAPPGNPAWGVVGDVQFAMKNFNPTKILASNSPGVTWGDYRSYSCFIPSACPHNANWFAQGSQTASSISMLDNDVNFPRVQDNQFGLRFRSIENHFEKDGPTMKVTVEYMPQSASAVVAYHGPMRVQSNKERWAEAIKSITLTGCAITLASDINSNCTLVVQMNGQDTF